ncbi:MAG: helix-hairpin-helix domain-containing protein [Sphingomonadales bacterium]|nr:helix-hairpin-helix domain-containing protein [Sphingomonadales bacterium]
MSKIYLAKIKEGKGKQFKITHKICTHKNPTNFWAEALKDPKGGVILAWMRPHPTHGKNRPGPLLSSQKDRLGTLLLGLLLLLYLLVSLPPKSSSPPLISADSPRIDSFKRNSKSTAYNNTGAISSYKKNYYKVLSRSQGPVSKKFDFRGQKPDLVPFKRQARSYDPTFLNSADSADLEKLPGIGPVLASRIIRYRNKLGGFYEKAQLREVYGISDSLFSLLQPLLLLTSSNALIRTIDINHICFDSLRQHPYLRWEKARAIIRYREANGPFRSEKDLRNIWTLDSLTLAKILPYILFDSAAKMGP